MKHLTSTAYNGRYYPYFPKNNKFISYNACRAIDASKLDDSLKDHIKNRIREAHELYIRDKRY